MCEIKYDHPYIYLFEFHIGDGYFDRQSIGEYTVIVNYRDNDNLIVKEKERGDDRLVKFRQGKSVIFGITKPDEQFKVIFQAFDNNEEIGKSSIYFIGIGAPNVLAAKSLNSPTASVIRTNLQLSHSTGSLQVFARLTCFGESLLTNFSVSGEVNTEFDAYVNDIELISDETFTKCNFDVGHVNVSKDFDNIPNNTEVETNELYQLMDNIKLDKNIEDDSTLCFYEASSIIQEESDEQLKQTILEKKSERDNMQELVNTLLHKAVNVGNTTNFKQIRNLDDLMFTNFDQIDEQNNNTENQFLLSADNSVLDLKEVYDDNNEIDDNNIEIIDEECIESNIGDAPLKFDDIIEEESCFKSIENLQLTDDKKFDDIPCDETGDAGELKDKNTTIKLGQKRRISRKSKSGDSLESDSKSDDDNYYITNELDEDELDTGNGSSATIPIDKTERKFAKGKRRNK